MWLIVSPHRDNKSNGHGDADEKEVVTMETDEDNSRWVKTWGRGVVCLENYFSFSFTLLKWINCWSNLWHVLAELLKNNRLDLWCFWSEESGFESWSWWMVLIGHTVGGLPVHHVDAFTMVLHLSFNTTVNGINWTYSWRVNCAWMLMLMNVVLLIWYSSKPQ